MADSFQWILVFWFFLVGGAIGSFLNVVVYRLPRGESLTHPPSHCPRCGHAIRWHDNLPVLGWLLLKGKCRDCRLPISVRYPIVEGATALLFGSVALRWIFATEHVWPVRPRLVRGDVFFPPLSEFEVLVAACWILLLLTTLWTAGLIEWDRQKVPRRLFLPALLVGLIVPWFQPFLHPVSLLPFSLAVDHADVEAWPMMYRGGSLLIFVMLEQLAGMVLGGLVGIVFARGVASGEKTSSCEGRARPVALAAVGGFLGWQVVVLAAVPLAVFQWVLRLLGKRSAFLLGLTALVFLLSIGRDWVGALFS